MPAPIGSSRGPRAFTLLMGLLMATTASALEPPPQALDVPAARAASDEQETGTRRSRYTFVAGGLLLLGGTAFVYSAQGEAKRADTVASAQEARTLVQRANGSVATATVLYGLAILTIGYAVVMEFLPPPAADAASLTFHF